MSNRIDSSEMQPLKFEEPSDSSIFDELDVRGYRATGTLALPSEFAATPTLADATGEDKLAENGSQTCEDPEITAAADVISRALNEKGPYNVATTSAIEKCIQAMAAAAPKGTEKDSLGRLSTQITAKTEFNAKITPSQFSDNRVMVSLGYRDRDQVIRFSVSKHA